MEQGGGGGAVDGRRIPLQRAAVLTAAINRNPWHGRRKTRAGEQHAIVETNAATITPGGGLLGLLTSQTSKTSLLRIVGK